MGVNIYLETADGRAHPQWDSNTLAGDKELFHSSVNLLKQYRDDEMEWFRPGIWFEWMQLAFAIDQNNNQVRLTKLIALAWADGDYLIRFSA